MDLSTSCREFRGARKGDRGYGHIYREGRYWGLHRWVWTQVHGPIPDGLVVMHTCDNPPCFRLSHLRLGTQAENMADKVAKGRASGGRHQAEKTHCPMGHEYTEENTYRFPSRPNARACKTCVLDRNRKARRERKLLRS